MKLIKLGQSYVNPEHVVCVRQDSATILVELINGTVIRLPGKDNPIDGIVAYLSTTK